MLATMLNASCIALPNVPSNPGAARSTRAATRSVRVVTRSGRPARTTTPAALSLDGPDSISGEARYTTLEVGDFAKLDLGRTARTGLPEVVWGPGKTPEQIAKIMLALRDRQSAVMATRVDPEVYERIRAIEPSIEYDAFARVCTLAGAPDAPPTPVVRGILAVLTAGTADLAVAEEAAITARLMGVEDVRLIADVGVAGLQRLLSRLDEVREADVVMVVAGMDGALPACSAGLVGRSRHRGAHQRRIRRRDGRFKSAYGDAQLVRDGGDGGEHRQRVRCDDVGDQDASSGGATLQKIKLN